MEAAKAQNWAVEPKEKNRSRDSSWLRAAPLRGPSPSTGRVKNFLFSAFSRTALGSTQPPIQWVPGAVTPGLKRQRLESDDSTPTSTEVKKMWICPCDYEMA
jgi:hypothetical protein